MNLCPTQRLVYVHSVLKSALEHAIHEEEIPRNVAHNVRTRHRRSSAIPSPHVY
ncbi:hypothetical protein [Streptomyces sp. NBC_01190]|uniref:hypothetical protein n=1 Tax=Streptomyces sp. NBC_01190 TaxID=2903767 RepID=UPI0038665317|nr:hypothetical protein OG519_29010 [Streptomyces sp. NBC_01190]